MKCLLILIFCFIFSCAKHRELIGTWKVRNYTIWERGIGYLKGARQYNLGTELMLNPDSLYKQKTCGSIFVGTWTRKGDSLILSCHTIWYRNVNWCLEHVDKNYDSVNGKSYHERIAYIIKNDKLFRIDTSKSYRMNPDGSIKEVKGYSLEILK